MDLVKTASVSFAAGQQDLLDLDTGRVMQIDAAKGTGFAEIQAWVEQNHPDVGGVTDSVGRGLLGWDLVAMPTAAASWDSLPAAVLIGMQKDFLGACKPGTMSFLTADIVWHFRESAD